MGVSAMSPIVCRPKGAQLGGGRGAASVEGCDGARPQPPVDVGLSDHCGDAGRGGGGCHRGQHPVRCDCARRLYPVPGECTQPQELGDAFGVPLLGVERAGDVEVHGVRRECSHARGDVLGQGQELFVLVRFVPSRAGSGRAHVGRTGCRPVHHARPVSRTGSAGPLVESSPPAPAAAVTGRRRRTESGCPLMVPPTACCRSAGTAASAGAGLRARDGLLGNLLGGPFRRRTATDGAHRLVVEPRLPQVSAAFRAAIWKERGSATGSDHVPDLVMPMPKTGAVGWAASPMHGNPARSQRSSRASSSSQQVRACARSASREDGPCESGHATLRAFGAALGVAPAWG